MQGEEQERRPHNREALGVFEDIEDGDGRTWSLDEMEEEGEPFHSEPYHSDPAEGFGCDSEYTGKPLECSKQGHNMMQFLKSPLALLARVPSKRNGLCSC